MNMARKNKVYATKEKIEQINDNNAKLIDKYFSFKNMNLSDSSKANYKSDFNQWLVFIMERYNNQYIIDIVEEDIDEMVDLLEDFIAFCTTELENKERRVQRRLSSISSFFLYLRKKRKIKENPIDYMDRPRVGAKEKVQVKQTYLTEEQINDARQKLNELGNKQLELFFEFGLTTMARINAISNVRLDQIDFETDRVEDVIEKEGYSVTLYPSSQAMQLIKEWIEHRKENGIENEYLFITKYDGRWKKAEKTTFQSYWIKKIGNLIGVPELHCHDLRHSGSDLFKKKGMSLEDVSNLLNHKSTEVTQNFYLQEDKDALQDNKKKIQF